MSPRGLGPSWGCTAINLRSPDTVVSRERSKVDQGPQTESQHPKKMLRSEVIVPKKPMGATEEALQPKATCKKDADHTKAKSTKKRERETEPIKVQKRRKMPVTHKYVVDESDGELNLEDSPGVTLEEVHHKDMEPVDHDSRETVEGCPPRRSLPKSPYPSP